MGRILSAEAALDVASVAPGATVEIHAVIDLTASGERLDRQRPAFTVAFVLDTSGSMAGEPVRQVIDSVGRLVDLLGDGDRAAIVAFSDNPTVIAPLVTLAGPGRAQLKRRAAALAAEGRTGMGRGIETGRRELPARGADERQMLILLSDGQPTDGLTPEAIENLARSFRPDVATVALGYGPSHDANLMQAFARGGGGEYWYIPIQPAGVEFARAIGTQGDIVVDGIEVVLAPGEGVEIAEALGARTRFGREGAIVSVPDLRDGQTHTLVVRLVVHAPREVGRRSAVGVTVRHRAVGETAVRTVETELAIAVSTATGAGDPGARRKVALARAELRRIAARTQADQKHYDAAASILRQVVSELEAVPGYAKLDGSPLSEAVEQLLDEIAVYEKKPSATQYAEYLAGTALQVDIAQGAGTRRAGSAGTRVVAEMLDKDVAGEVEIRQAGRPVRMVALRAEMFIGRSSDSDIAVHSDRVSRRHALLQCHGGKVVVRDLGSTNATEVNGAAISRREVGPSDVIRVGDVDIVVRRVR